MGADDPSPDELARRQKFVEKLHELDAEADAEPSDGYDVAEVVSRRLPPRNRPADGAALVVRLDCDRITDWDSFHTVFADVFGFPGFYGRNMNAWIDCMGWLDGPGSGMISLTVPAGGVLTLQLDGVAAFAARCPEQYAALNECAAFVNWRRSSEGEGAIIALAFFKDS